MVKLKPADWMKQDNSDVGARERNKIKQTIQQNKPELDFSRQELKIWPLGDELENSTAEP